MTEFKYFKQYHDEPDRFEIKKAEMVRFLAQYERNPRKSVEEMESTGRNYITPAAVYTVEKKVVKR